MAEEVITYLDEVDRRQASAPLPLYPSAPPSKDYPVDALGAILARAAGAIQRKVQVPMSIAAQSVLAAASLAAQAHADVKLPYGQTRPLSIYLVTVAGSGDRKSSGDNEALWPVRKREKALKERYDADLEAWSAASAAWHAERKKIEGDRQLELGDRKAALIDLGPEPGRPLYPLLTVADPTIEGLSKAWVNAPAALGIFASEGGSFVGGSGMNSDNRLKTAAALSEIWDGKAIKRVRAGDGVTILDGRRLAVHLMMQADVAAGFFCDGVLRDQGLLSRVLVAAPESMAGKRFYREPTPEDESAIYAYGARILSLLEAAWPLAEGKVNELEPRALTMDADAKAAWIDFFNSVEEGSGKGEKFADIRDFASKAAEHAARIAGVLTIVQDVDAQTIARPTMDAAVTLVDWYMAEALRLTVGSTTDTRLTRAMDLLTWMKARGTSVVGFRDILRLGPSHARMKQSADEIVSILIDHGWLTEEAGRPRRLRLVG